MSHTDQEILMALRPKRPKGPARGARKSLLGVAAAVFLALAVFVDFLTFSISASLFGEEDTPSAYLDHRLKLSKLSTFWATESLPERDYNANPLIPSEKAAYADRMHLALPAAPEGWTRAPFTTADFWTLRKDLVPCQKYDDKLLKAKAMIGDSRGCPPGLGGDGFHVYTRGVEQIALMLRYIPADPTVPRAEALRNAPLPDFAAANFAQSRGDRTLTPFTRVRNWSFGVLPMTLTRRSGAVSDLPLRIYARNGGQGTVDIFAVSTASATTTKHLLSQIDFAFLNAMLAPTADG
ncbi:hypothetical protein ACOXXX_13650 [Thalassococcus sp. BH17M4-6]|uniref:hypothetical protein n=1 Tax=Thalassococcus sp. BH17M4-6 TaxID=3413148 RepID=UPI003BDF75E3